MRERGYNDLNDDLLWTQLISGDESALEMVYRKYYAMLLNYGMRFVPEHELVEDCIHDLFIKIYHNSKLSHPPRVYTYLLKSLRNLLFDRIRNQKRYGVIDEMEFSLLLDETTLSTYIETNDREQELVQRLFQACEALPFNQKHAIHLRFTEGLNYQEISSMLNINQQSAMNLVSRALTNIRERMV